MKSTFVLAQIASGTDPEENLKKIRAAAEEAAAVCRPDVLVFPEYCMSVPQTGVVSPAEPLDLLNCPPLTFAQPDREVFSCLRMAEEAAAEGGTACAILNAANEEAVGLFLTDRIGFHDIAGLVAKARSEVKVVQHPSLDEILAADAAAREVVLR